MGYGFILFDAKKIRYFLFECVMDLHPLVPTKYQFSTMATANAITTNLIGA
jgi:hypothetical protein